MQGLRGYDPRARCIDPCCHRESVPVSGKVSQGRTRGFPRDSLQPLNGTPRLLVGRTGGGLAGEIIADTPACPLTPCIQVVRFRCIQYSHFARYAPSKRQNHSLIGCCAAENSLRTRVSLKPHVSLSPPKLDADAKIIRYPDVYHDEDSEQM